MSPKKYLVHVVPETHWDREWYSSFEEFRIRLIEVTNDILAILKKDPDYKYFVFDGQTIVLEDYLQIHPEKKDEIRRLVKKGRLFIGPWYILPDEFLVSGEATVRNLLIGRKVADEFGPAMKVGYVPDPFGHISQLPQILNGFGLDSFMFSRGMGIEGKKLGSEFIWKGPDGSKVIAVRTGYCNAANLGHENAITNKIMEGREKVDLKVACNQARWLVDNCLESANTPHLLLNNGMDHTGPQSELPKMLKHLNSKFSDAKFIHTNYELFIKEIRKFAKNFRTYTGEMRKGYYWAVLPDVISTRMYLKQANERAQNMLEKYIEPLASMAFINGGEYRDRLILQAWKYLLQNHPHDSICGCSIDDVHNDMERRFSWVMEIGSKLNRDVMEYMGRNIDTRLESRDTLPLVLYNTLGWERCNEAVTLDLKLPENVRETEFELFNTTTGRKLPVELVGAGKELWSAYDGKYRHVTVRFTADSIPAYGYALYALEPVRKNTTVSTGKNLGSGKNFIENEYYRVCAGVGGSLTVTDRKNRAVYKDMHVFEDIEDAGDEYNYSPIKKTKKILSSKSGLKKISVISNGPVSVTMKIDLELQLPAALSSDRKTRSTRTVKCPVSTSVTLYRGCDRIDMHTTVTNRAKDHRLRVLFPSSIKAQYSNAESQFDVVKRSVKLPPLKGSKTGEIPVATYPQQNFVSINDSKKGMTVINTGLPEYEAYEGKKGTGIALTLLRCVGWLSREDMINRPGHAGPYQIESPGGQCQGTHDFSYSLVLHKGDWLRSTAWRKAYEHNTPVTGYITVQSTGKLSATASLVDIKASNIVLSAVKKSEKGRNLILRFYDISGKRSTVDIAFHRDVRKAVFVNMNEESQAGKLTVKASNVISCPVGPHRIVTVSVSFKA